MRSVWGIILQYLEGKDTIPLFFASKAFDLTCMHKKPIDAATAMAMANMCLYFNTVNENDNSTKKFLE